MNSLRSTFPTDTHGRAKDLTGAESAWLQQWASRDNRKYGWNMDEIVRLILGVESGMTYFDRFDICEAWNVWAHDWGEYAIITRLQRMHFSSSRSAEFYDGLSENGKAIHDALNARSEQNPYWKGRR